VEERDDGRVRLRWPPLMKLIKRFFSFLSNFSCLALKVSSLTSSKSESVGVDPEAWSVGVVFNSLHLGVMISLYSNFSSRVADATEYGITMLSISNEGVWLCGRLFLRESEGVRG
jgi:hypothetical protein